MTKVFLEYQRLISHLLSHWFVLSLSHSMERGLRSATNIFKTEKMKEHVFALDLKNDPEKIMSYIVHHKNVWPTVVQKIKASGVLEMRIFQLANRLVMIVKVEDDFSIEKDPIGDPSDP